MRILISTIVIRSFDTLIDVLASSYFKRFSLVAVAEQIGASVTSPLTAKVRDADRYMSNSEESIYCASMEMAKISVKIHVYRYTPNRSGISAATLVDLNIELLSC